MTSAHVLYIPTIFLLGFLVGTLMSAKPNHDAGSVHKSGITGRTLLISAMIFVFVFIGTHFFEVPRSSKAVTKALNGMAIFDKSPSYTSEDVYMRLAMFPEDGREIYKQFTYTIDVLFPLSLFAFTFLLAKYTARRVRGNQWLPLAIQALPVVWLGMDFVENACIFVLLDSFPIRYTGLAASLGYITTVKFSLLFLSVLAPASTIAYLNISGPGRN